MGLYTLPSLERLSGFDHGFTARSGGVSEGYFASLNLSFSRPENRDNVMENYRIFCSMVIYPVIPKGLVIFRIVCTAAHTDEDIAYTLNAFKEIKQKLDAGAYDGDDIAAKTIM